MTSNPATVGASRLGHPPELCLVIPCYNEEKVLPMLVEHLVRFIRTQSHPVKVLLVDDGSRDQTFPLIEQACQAHPEIAGVRFSRNFGHQTAVSAGLQLAGGDVVAVLDADLQDPVDVVPRMLAKWEEGYDVVYGVRQNRKEGWLLRTCYALFYRLLKSIANIDLPLDAGDFCIMDRRVVDLIKSMPEHNRFVRGLRGWVGFRQMGLPYDRQARAAGEPKYNLKRLMRLAFDGIISFSTAPLKFAIWLGVASSALGFLMIVWALFSVVFLSRTPPGWASLAVLILFFSGVQILVLGLVGEYVGRIFDEVKNRPHFVVSQRVGWTAAP